MKAETEAYIRSLLEQTVSQEHITPEQVPAIDLYMDQVTSFIDSHLGGGEHSEQGPVLTKTMINNYAKNKLIPPPDKKKYNSEHIFLLIFIYYFKKHLSIGEIQALMSPLTERYFDQPDFSLKDIYSEVFARKEAILDGVCDDVARLMEQSSHTFSGREDADEQDSLQLFALIHALEYDIYVKKQLIQSLIDTLTPGTEEPEKKKKEGK